MTNIECAICSEDYGKRDDSSNVIVTPCGHVFHEMCLSKWLVHCIEKTCPECRAPVTMEQTQRIYLKLSPTLDNVQTHIDFLNATINRQKVKLHMAEVQSEAAIKQLKQQLRKLLHTNQIQRFYWETKNRELNEMYNQKNAQIINEVKELHNRILAIYEPPIGATAPVEANTNENVRLPLPPSPSTRTDPTLVSTSMNPIPIPQNYNASTSWLSQNSANSQSSGIDGASVCPFENNPNQSMNWFSTNVTPRSQPLANSTNSCQLVPNRPTYDEYYFYCEYQNSASSQNPSTTEHWSEH